MLNEYLSMKRFPQIAIPTRKPYLSDLSDHEWEVMRPLLPTPKGFGHPRAVDLREILNAIFYVQRTGCQWEMLPNDFPPHTTSALFKIASVKITEGNSNSDKSNPDNIVLVKLILEPPICLPLNCTLVKLQPTKPAKFLS